MIGAVILALPAVVRSDDQGLVPGTVRAVSCFQETSDRGIRRQHSTAVTPAHPPRGVSSDVRVAEMHEQ